MPESKTIWNVKKQTIKIYTQMTTITIIDKLRKSPAQAYQNTMLIIAPGQPFEAIDEHLIDL